SRVGQGFRSGSGRGSASESGLVGGGELGDHVVHAGAALLVDDVLEAGHVDLSDHVLVVGVVHGLVDRSPRGVVGDGGQRLGDVDDGVLVVLGDQLVGKVHHLVG